MRTSQPAIVGPPTRQPKRWTLGEIGHVRTRATRLPESISSVCDPAQRAFEVNSPPSCPGTSCRIQGWAAGTNVSVDLDGQPFMFSPPANPDDTFMILRDLPVEWHALRIVATAFQVDDSNLSITRVVVDTGLPE